MTWYKVEDKEPPKDRQFLTKTSYPNGDKTQVYILYWISFKYNEVSKGMWACQCGCKTAEDCIIGDIIEWMEIPE